MTSLVGDPDPQLEPQRIGALVRIRRYLLEFSAIFFWLYLVPKVFAFDIDEWLVGLIAPQYVWVLNFKFAALVAVLVAMLLGLGSKNTARTIAYITLYPAIIVCWKLPKFIWNQKSWLLALVIVNFAISAFLTFRRTFFAAAVVLFSVLAIFILNKPIVLYAGIIGLLAVLTASYARALIRAFRPSAIFALYMKAFAAVPSIASANAKGSVSADKQQTSGTNVQVSEQTTKLQTLVLYNRACLLIARRLREYQRSRLNLVSYLAALVLLLLFTVFSFAVMNYSVFKLDASAFQATYAARNFFGFFYYSAGCLFYASNGMLPTSALSQAVQLTEFLFAIFLLVIITTVIIATRDQRHSEDLDKVVILAERAGREIEGTIKTEFNVGDVSSAIESLKQAQAGLTQVIVWLTNGIGDDRLK